MHLQNPKVLSWSSPPVTAFLPAAHGDRLKALLKNNVVTVSSCHNKCVKTLGGGVDIVAGPRPV